MKKVTFLAIIACILVALFTNTAYSQSDKKNIEKKITSKSVETARGKDANIKEEAPTVDKRETQTRSPQICQIYFDNYSGLYVKVYVDSKYKGTLSPYGSLNVYVYSGYTTIYCKSTGGTRYWSDAGDCDGYYHFELHY